MSDQQPRQLTLNVIQTAEVVGIIISVKFPTRKSDPTTFRIHCPNMGQSFDAVCSLFCPIRQGDTIYALCSIGPNNVLHVNKPPFVQPAIDRDSIIQCFIRALKQGYKPAVATYNTISRIADGDKNVIPFLTGISQSWNDTRNQEILHMFDGIDSDEIKKLLTWWHKERNLRRLYLFGLTKKEINACRMTCDEIFQGCMNNPYTIPAIPIEKCDAILDRVNKRPNADDRFRGGIVRMIWTNLHERGWMGTPTRMLAKQFPGIRSHIDILRESYNIVAELETAYLKFPHKVETWMAEYLINMVKSDPITYDMPLDQRITLEDGRVVERVSAHFNKEMSEDQIKAVQGALDHRVCIVTGSGGCGKCVHPETPILMFDGTIKEIRYIQVGELVMGPDSLPRTVLSKCFGIDEMFTIIPSKGRPFICNAPHVLTLKGFKPYLGFRTDKQKGHIGVYSDKGIRRTKAFLTEQEAQTFIDRLPEDIFDLPLNEYMKRTPGHQEYCYLFHTGIDFPERELPMDPYLIGYWLGDGDSGDSMITTADPEIVEEFYRILSFYNMTLSQYTPIRYYVRGQEGDYSKHGGNKFLNVIRDLNMKNNKHIPDIYKCNSRENRLKLLAGLIDSDGYSYQGCIEITQLSKKLADDIEYLAFSLGFMITRVEKEGGCIYRGEMRNGIYQRMTIFGEGLEDIPVILERKKSAPRQIKKRATCLRFDVKSRGSGIYCGFELSGDGRFLLSDFLVTHNTRVLGQIIHNLELRGIPYAVCSFTGKAVSRIREVTGKKNPSTMHRLIMNAKKTKSGRSNQFELDIPMQDYEHVVIDEVSMVTLELLYDFLQAYPNIYRLTLVGDVNQLCPIGPGCLLDQLLKSETIPCYKLSTNFRVYASNGERDGIILNANALMSHDPQFPFEFVQTSNFSLIEGPIERVYDIIRGCYAGGIKADQVTVLTPYNRYLDVLNSTFQSIYNDGARFVTDSRGIKWRVGDRVMLTKNDEEIGVFNGESGTIKDVSEVAILVNFGQSGFHEFLLEPTQNRVNYEQGTTNSYYQRERQMEEVLDGDEGEIDDERTVKRLQLSFSLSIDKSQGSEWDFVILFIPEFNTGSFVNKNRVYTAFSRSKRACWCVIPDIELFNQAAVKPAPKRFENLARRLKTELSNLKPFRLPAPIPQLEMNGEMPMLPEDMIPEDAFDTGFDCDDY